MQRNIAVATKQMPQIMMSIPWYQMMRPTRNFVLQVKWTIQIAFYIFFKNDPCILQIL